MIGKWWLKSRPKSLARVWCIGLISLDRNNMNQVTKNWKSSLQGKLLTNNRLQNQRSERRMKDRNRGGRKKFASNFGSTCQIEEIRNDKLRTLNNQHDIQWKLKTFIKIDPRIKQNKQSAVTKDLNPVMEVTGKPSGKKEKVRETIWNDWQTNDWYVMTEV